MLCLFRGRGQELQRQMWGSGWKKNEPRLRHEKWEVGGWRSWTTILQMMFSGDRSAETKVRVTQWEWSIHRGCGTGSGSPRVAGNTCAQSSMVFDSTYLHNQMCQNWRLSHSIYNSMTFLTFPANGNLNSPIEKLNHWMGKHVGCERFASGSSDFRYVPSRWYLTSLGVVFGVLEKTA